MEHPKYLALLEATIDRVLMPFRTQNVSPIYIARSENPLRIYIGVVCPTVDTATGAAPKHVVRTDLAGIESVESRYRLIDALQSSTVLPDKEPDTSRHAVWLAVSTTLGLPKLVVTVNAGGKRRSIDYTWNSKTDHHVPPKEWWRAVLGEIDYQCSSQTGLPRELL